MEPSFQTMEPSCQTLSLCSMDRASGVQTFNVKFRFDDSGLEVVLGKQEEETENAFVGGKNRWEFESFTNWEFWWPSFPVLVYFKVSLQGSPRTALPPAQPQLQARCPVCMRLGICDWHQ